MPGGGPRDVSAGPPSPRSTGLLPTHRHQVLGGTSPVNRYKVKGPQLKQKAHAKLTTVKLACPQRGPLS